MNERAAGLTRVFPNAGMDEPQEENDDIMGSEFFGFLKSASMSVVSSVSAVGETPMRGTPMVETDLAPPSSRSTRRAARRLLPDIQ